MTVDEDNLVSTIRSLRALQASMEQNIDEIKNMVKLFSKIELDNDQPKTDADTGQTMTADRRNRIYDNNITKAKRLLSRGSSETL